MTIAIIDSLINSKEFAQSYKEQYRKHPSVGYGRSFKEWAEPDSYKPYNSWGNGSAMRVSPIVLNNKKIEEIHEKIEKSAEVSHKHPEGIKGAQVTHRQYFLRGQVKQKRK